MLGWVEPSVREVPGGLERDRQARAGRRVHRHPTLFIGALGVPAVVIGSASLGVQRGAWIFLGAIHLVIGASYLSGRARSLMISLGPSLGRISGLRGSACLGVLLSLNIPACAAPLVFGLLSMAAAGGAAGGTLVAGFISLGLFAFALSLLLVLAVLLNRPGECSTG